MVREINTARDAGDGGRVAALAAELKSLGNVLGLLSVPAQEWARLGKSAGGEGALSDADVAARIAARTLARQGKNWVESDRIRDELAVAGIILEDKAAGQTVWRRA